MRNTDATGTAATEVKRNMNLEAIKKGEWSLDELYTGYDDPAFAADMKEAEEQIAFLEQYTQTFAGTPAENLLKVLEAEERIQDTLGKAGLYLGLRQSACTTDAKAGSLMDQLRARASAMAGPDTRFQKYVAGLADLDAVLQQDPKLAGYSWLLKNMQADARYLLDDKCESIISLYENSGSGAWGNLQEYLTSTVPVSYRGKTITLSEVRSLAYDADPEVRKDAFHAEMECYPRICDAVAYSLNSIKLEVLNRCRLKGFESPMAETLWNARVSRKTLDALLEAIREYLPRLQKYYRAKAKLLGHPGGLPWYDLFAPIGNDEARYTKEDAKEYLVKRFSGFDADLAEMVRTAFDEGWIDFYPREGKVGGAFCAEAFSLRASRILTNFTGSFNDVVTLAHELGHAFHNRNLNDNLPLNRDYSMPVAETASTFNEVLVLNDAIRAEQDPIRRRTLMDEMLSGDLQIICDIYSRYRFEDGVFGSRDESFLFAPELCERMLAAQKEGYGDGLDYTEPHTYMWVCKSHYYSGGQSYYNWPYAFGGMLARGLYAKYEEEGSAFVARYRAFLKATAEMSAEDAGRVAGIDLTDVAFWRSSLEGLAKDVEAYCRLCDM